MEYRDLGRTGIKVSALCLGTYNFGGMTPDGPARQIMRTAVDAGINFFDTADSYFSGESERIVGRFLRDAGLRDAVFLTSKVYYGTGDGPNDAGLSRHHVIEACEASLRRLQTDHLDLYLTHRMAMSIPIEETLSALTDLVRRGKVRYIGCSTHPAWAVVEAILVSEMRGYARYVMESPPYNILDRRIENELIPMCQRYGVGISPWSPLAMGMLAGRYAVGGSFPEGSRAAANSRAWLLLTAPGVIRPPPPSPRACSISWDRFSCTPRNPRSSSGSRSS